MTAAPVPPPTDRTDAIRVRPMRPEESARVGEITLSSYDAYGTIDGPYRDVLADPRRRMADCTALLVAELDSRLVGTVTFVVPGDGAWEDRPEPQGDAGFRVLAVDPTAEGHGVGRRLATECIDRARTLGKHRMVIVTMAWMHRAHRLYAGLGFVHRPDLDIRFPSGVGHVLTLDLTSEAPRRFPAPGPVPSEVPWFEDVWDLR